MKFLNSEVVDDLLRTENKVLGNGTFGEVLLVSYHNEPAALKVSKSRQKKIKNKYLRHLPNFLNEAEILYCLQGAGGAPLLHGVHVNPPALLMQYKGSQSLLDVIKDPEFDLLAVGLEIGKQL